MSVEKQKLLENKELIQEILHQSVIENPYLIDEVQKLLLSLEHISQTGGPAVEPMLKKLFAVSPSLEDILDKEQKY